MGNIFDHIRSKLDQIEAGNTFQSQSVRKQVEYLCELLGVDIQDLALAMAFRGVSASKIANTLGIRRRTLYRWDKARKAITVRNIKESNGPTDVYHDDQESIDAEIDGECHT